MYNAMVQYRSPRIQKPVAKTAERKPDYDKLLCERDELVMDKIDLENQIIELKQRLNNKHFENDVLQERLDELDVLCADIQQMRLEHNEMQKEMRQIEGRCIRDKRRLEKELEIILSDIKVAGLLCCVCQKSMSLFCCSQCKVNFCRVCYSSKDLCAYCNGAI